MAALDDAELKLACCGWHTSFFRSNASALHPGVKASDKYVPKLKVAHIIVQEMICVETLHEFQIERNDEAKKSRDISAQQVERK